MSVRDDWRLDRTVRSTDQRIQDRVRSDRDQLPYVDRDDREDHRRQLEESTGYFSLSTVAAGALLAAGAYVGLKHFPSKLLSKARKSAAEVLESSSHPSWLTEIKKIFGRGGQPRVGVMDDVLAKDLEHFQHLFANRSGTIGNREAAISALLSKYQAPTSAPIPNQYPQQIRDLVQLRGFRAAATRMGIDPRHIANQLTHAATRPSIQTFGDLARKVASTRIPFTEWRPLELLMPTELLGRTPTLATLAGENMPSGKPGMFIGGSLFEMDETRVAGRKMLAIASTQVGTGYTLGRLGSGMGKAAAIRMGGTLAKPLEQILQERPDLQDPQGLWKKIERKALDIGAKTGVGPQYASRTPFGGRLREVSGVLQNIAYGEPEFINLQNQVWGVTPEGAWVRRMLADVGLGRKGPVTGAADLSWFERLKASIGIVPKRAAEVTRGGRTRRSYRPIMRFLDPAGEAIRKLPPSKHAALHGEYYAFKGVRQGLSDWFNYHLNRPMWLLEEMTGLGLQPGKTPLESMWRIGTRVALPAYLAYQGLQYSEYKSRKYFGLGPISGPAYLYTQGRIAAQTVLDSSGVTDAVTELEERFPGLMESPFSKAAAIGGGTVGGTMIGRHVGAGKGAAIGMALGATSGLLFAAGVSQDAETLRDIYEGEQEVPVHADRWWVLGRHPFGGSRIKYWKKHWFAEMMSDYKDKAIYGSRKEAWRGSWLPVPENWFLLKNIYDPYYVENLHYHDRPYPTTAPLFEDVPLVGPLAGATVGRIFKPTMYRHVQAPGAQGAPRDALLGQAEAVRLGMAPVPMESPIPTTKWTMQQLTGETLHRLFDWSGMPGFMLGAIKENLTGEAGWAEGDTLLASSGMITSPERDFYDRNLGGLLGGTEFLRRFIPRGRRNGFYNPIQNIAPEWLPGHRSVFPGDRAGYLDFHTGDPYTALEKGESRLPGAGFEALHGLHSGTPGVYDDFDKFKILADVAPYSDAFKHYKRVLDQQVHQGALSDQDVQRYYQTIDNMAERMESRISSTNARFSTGAFAEDTVTVSSILSPTEFQTREMPGVTFKLAGINDRPATMDGTQLGQYYRLKQKLWDLQGQQVRMTWGGPGVETPAILGDLNRDMIASGLEADRLTGLGYQAKYGQGGLPAMWERMIHTRLPGPLDYPRVKWMGTRSGIEEYEQFQYYGTADTNWSKPFDNYIIPWYNQATFTPNAETARARQITEHMDNLEYLKYRKLEDQALRRGDVQLASQFHQRSSQTMVALQANQPNFWANIYRSMPPVERPYFNVFAGTTSEAEQERIIRAVPDYMRRHYLGLWKRKMPAGQQFNSPILRRYEEVAQAESEQPVDSRVAEFFASHPTPPKDWMGWHPGVDLEAVTIKTANQEGIDIHRLGLWESQALQAEQTYPDVEGVDIRPSMLFEEDRDQVLSALHSAGYNDFEVQSNSDGVARFQMHKKRSRYWAAFNSPFNAAQYSGREW